MAQSSGQLVISEFMASNVDTILDEDGVASDWIELHNTTSTIISLQGYYLTDDSAQMDKWAFPNMTIGAGEYLIIFASNKDRTIAGSELHTNFKLAASGEYLGLSDGSTTVENEFSPTYPQQYENVAFGLNSSGDERYFTPPTAANSNGSGIFPYAAVAPAASVARGFYSTPQSVALSAEPGATIRYTIDGTQPTASTGNVYSSPISIDSTTTLRALAILGGANSSTVQTFSYIFLDDVIEQQTPADWPTGTVNDQRLNYGMDPNVVNGQRTAVKQALKSLPSVSIVTDIDNLFNPDTGIYVNAEQKGAEWERPISVEWLHPDNSEGFQIDAGLRMRGGYSRRGNNPKHSFRFYFNGNYGGKLNYPLFGDEGVDTFKKLDLRTAQNYSWSFSGSDRNTFLREVWSRDTQAAMGQPYTRSSYVHVYLNGQYWGIFMTQERVSEEYAEDYYGGSEADYDVIKHFMDWSSTGSVHPDSGKYEVSAGSDAEWKALWQLIQDQNVSSSEYEQIKEMVDIDSLIDSQLVRFYSGDSDSVISNFLSNKRGNNWYALRDRTRNGAKWTFFAHDAEHSLGARDHDTNIDRIGPFPVLGDNEYYSQEYFNPTWLHQALTSNSQYVEEFKFRAWQHLKVDGGALTASAARARWDQRKAQVESALLAESARWGNSAVGTPLGVSEWQTEVSWVENSWFPDRSNKVMDQLAAKNLGTNSQPSAPATPAPPTAKMILNEYNAVDKTELLQEGGSDTTFGQVLGNGGDWFELVTVVDNLDIRGWRVEIWDADNFSGSRYRTDVFEFADKPLLATLRRGTILTISEDVPDEISYDPASGDWWINLQANGSDAGAYFTPDTQSNFDTNSKNWQVVIRDAAGNLVFGPAGEDAGAFAPGVGNAEVGKLEENPTTSISATAAYNDGTTSTFGAPNLWDGGATTQDFSTLRSVVPINTPTATPTNTPTDTPTAIPTNTPTAVPTNTPTAVPTNTPTAIPTNTPTAIPTNTPTAVPTNTPTAVPTNTPTAVPTNTPTAVPTNTPTAIPTNTPTAVPTNTPTAVPTNTPTAIPTNTPTAIPTNTPTAIPTNTPTAVPQTNTCTTYTSTDIPKSLPVGNTQTSSTIDVTAEGSISKLSVSINMSHEWVGDLEFKLNHQVSGLTALLINRPGIPGSTWGCQRDDIDVTLDNSNGIATVDTQCTLSIPTINGTFTPEQALSLFVDQNANGPWVLEIIDHYAAADGGVLNGWGMEICTNGVSPVSTPASTSVSFAPTSTPQPTPTLTPTVQPDNAIYFEDDFESDQGWTTDPANTDTATTGQWQRGGLEKTSHDGYIFQLNEAHSGVTTLATGPLAGSNVGKHDVDKGVTSIRSPLIALPSSSATTLTFAYYLSHWSNVGQADFLKVKVVGNTTKTLFHQTGVSQIKEGAWQIFSSSLDEFQGQEIYLLIEAADGETPSLVEAAIDDVRIAESTLNLAALDKSPPRNEAKILTNNMYLPIISNSQSQINAEDDPQ